MTTNHDPQSKPNSTSTTPSLPSTPAERTRRQAGLFFGGAAFALLSAVVTRRALARRYRAILSSTSPISASAPGAASRFTNPTSNTTVLSQGAPKSSEAPGYAAAASFNATASNQSPNQPPTSNANPNSDPNPSDQQTSNPDLSTSAPILALEAFTLATLNVFSWAVMLTGGTMWALDIGNVEDLRRKVKGGSGADGTGTTERQVEEELEEWIAGVLARKEQKEAVSRNEAERER